MNLKALIMGVLSLTSICNASMHERAKPVNKPMKVSLEDIAFCSEGMFLLKDGHNSIKLTKLENHDNDFIAFFRVDYVCGSCMTVYDENPVVCETCGSDDIRERDIDLWPVG